MNMQYILSNGHGLILPSAGVLYRQLEPHCSATASCDRLDPGSVLIIDTLAMYMACMTKVLTYR